MPDKRTVEKLMELKSNINDLQNEEPGRFPTEPEIEKGADESKRIELGMDAKTWEVGETLGTTRVEISLALEKAYDLIETLVDEIDRLKNHRHDYSKSYTGRPEL